MYTLYDYLPSGNGYKVRLLLTQLGLPFERIEMDILKGATRTAEFLAINPNGRIPVLRLPDGRLLAESNAILYFLAQDSEFFPADSFARGLVMQWLFFEQYSHEPYIATSRFYLTVSGTPEKYARQLERKRPGGIAALNVMEQYLEQRRFFVGDRYSIADIALFAYTHTAPDGGFSLDPYPAIRAWLARVAGQAGHIPLTRA